MKHAVYQYYATNTKPAGTIISVHNTYALANRKAKQDSSLAIAEVPANTKKGESLRDVMGEY